MGHVNMTSVRRFGDGKERNLNSSWEVFCSEISVAFNRHLDTLTMEDGIANEFSALIRKKIKIEDVNIETEKNIQPDGKLYLTLRQAF